MDTNLYDEAHKSGKYLFSGNSSAKNIQVNAKQKGTF
jgi:hypothetical protein